jgi:hypothetical protein
VPVQPARRDERGETVKGLAGALLFMLALMLIFTLIADIGGTP